MRWDAMYKTRRQDKTRHSPRESSPQQPAAQRVGERIRFLTLTNKTDAHDVPPAYLRTGGKETELGALDQDRSGGKRNTKQVTRLNVKTKTWR